MSIHKRNTKRLVVGDTVIETKHFTDHCISKDHPDFQKVAKIVRNRRVGKVVELVEKKMLAVMQSTMPWSFGMNTTARVASCNAAAAS